VDARGHAYGVASVVGVAQQHAIARARILEPQVGVVVFVLGRRLALQQEATVEADDLQLESIRRIGDDWTRLARLRAPLGLLGTLAILDTIDRHTGALTTIERAVEGIGVTITITITGARFVSAGV